MSLKTAIWVPGLTAQAQNPVETEVLRGWGKAFVGRWRSNWFHIPLTPPVSLEDVRPKLARVFGFHIPVTDARPKLTRVFVFYETNGAFINALHIYDGPSKVMAFDPIAIEGDHAGNRDASNTWVIDPPLEISFALGLSVCVTNNAYKKIETQGEEDTESDEAQGEEDTKPDEAGLIDKETSLLWMLMAPVSVLFTAAGAEFEVPGSDIQSGPGTNTLLPYERLHVGQWLISSNGMYTLHWEPDGRLVLVNTSDGSEKFSRGPFIPPDFLAYCEMQGDGNFVVKRHHKTSGVEAAIPVWDSETWGHPGAFLRVEDDGKLVIIDPVNRIWRRPE